MSGPLLMSLLCLVGAQCWASEGKLDRITALWEPPRLSRGKTQIRWLLCVQDNCRCDAVEFVYGAGRLLEFCGACFRVNHEDECFQGVGKGVSGIPGKAWQRCGAPTEPGQAGPDGPRVLTENGQGAT